MSRILVLYASTHGHTARIATRVAETIEATGFEVVLRLAPAPAA
jgi:flavodoxin